MIRDERGSVTIWVIGLVIVVLFLGGLSVDLWRALSERRELAGIATAAAAAGASGIDTELWRQSGELLLHQREATGLARDSLDRQPGAQRLSHARVTVNGGGRSVTVEVSTRVELTLLRVLGLTDEITLSAGATASPAVRR